MSDAIDSHLRCIEERRVRSAALTAVAVWLRSKIASLAQGEEAGPAGLSDRLERFAIQFEQLAFDISSGRAVHYPHRIAPLLSEAQRTGLVQINPFIAEVKEAFSDGSADE